MQLVKNVEILNQSNKLKIKIWWFCIYLELKKYCELRTINQCSRKAYNLSIWLSTVHWGLAEPEDALERGSSTCTFPCPCNWLCGKNHSCDRIGMLSPLLYKLSQLSYRKSNKSRIICDYWSIHLREQHKSSSPCIWCCYHQLDQTISPHWFGSQGNLSARFFVKFSPTSEFAEVK